MNTDYQERAKRAVDEFCAPGLDAIPKGDKSKTWLFASEEWRLQEIFERVIRESVEEERAACLAAVEGERLSDDTGDEGDRAYNMALEHAADAIRKRSEGES